jgi:hypothetical protein
MTIDVPAIIPFILAGALMLWALVTVGLAFSRDSCPFGTIVPVGD